MAHRPGYVLVEALRVVEEELRARNIVSVSFCSDDENYAPDGGVLLTTWSGVDNEYPIDHKPQPNFYLALEALSEDES